MQKILGAVALTAAVMSFGACATVTRGTKTAWEVKSEPPGAAVKTTNGFECKSTPCSIKMSRKAEFTATITKDGYKPLQIQVTHKIGSGGGAGMAGNVLVGGLIGVGVDATSGAMFDLTPNPVSVNLEKLAEAPVVAAARSAPVGAATLVDNSTKN
jgi:hypothetical protein